MVQCQSCSAIGKSDDDDRFVDWGEEATMRQAYLVAVLRRTKHDAPYELVRIDIFSEPAWQLTEVGDGVMYAQLAPSYAAKTYHEARARLEEIAAMHLPRVAHLFAW